MCNYTCKKEIKYVCRNIALINRDINNNLCTDIRYYVQQTNLTKINL